MDVFTLVGLPRIYAWHGCLGKCGTCCRCLRGDGNIIIRLYVEEKIVYSAGSWLMIVPREWFYYYYYFFFFGLLGGALVSIEMNENHENPDSDVKIVVL